MHLPPRQPGRRSGEQVGDAQERTEQTEAEDDRGLERREVHHGWSALPPGVAPLCASSRARSRWAIAHGDADACRCIAIACAIPEKPAAIARARARGRHAVMPAAACPLAGMTTLMRSPGSIALSQMRVCNAQVGACRRFASAVVCQAGREERHEGRVRCLHRARRWLGFGEEPRSPRHARRQSDQRRPDADASEQAARICLPELCLGEAGEAAPVRVLRERRQGDDLGADAEPRHAGLLRTSQPARTGVVGRPRSGSSGTPDPSAAL